MWRHGNRVDDHTALRAFDFIDFGSLLFDAEVFVNDANAPFLRQGNGEGCLSHRIHGRTHQRNVEDEVIGKQCRHLRLARQHLGAGWQEQDIVKR